MRVTDIINATIWTRTRAMSSKNTPDLINFACCIPDRTFLTLTKILTCRLRKAWSEVLPRDMRGSYMIMPASTSKIGTVIRNIKDDTFIVRW